MTDRWIKTYEKLLKWEWYGDPLMVATLIHLLLKANWKDKKWRGVDVKRGQLITSRTRLAEEIGLTERQLRTCLERMQETGEIACETTNRYTIITICNYDIYQDKTEAQRPAERPAESPTNDQQTTNKRPTGSQQTTTPIEYVDKTKNLYNSKEDEDDNAHARGMSSVVVGLVDFLSNWWDVNLTPAQVALIDSKPADYWESFKDEVEASKWLKQQDLGKVFALHRNVVDGQYRTFKDTTPPPVPTYTPPKEPEFTPREQAIIDDFNAWRKDNPDLRGVYVYLKQLAEKHGGIPENVYRALGMIYYAKSWHFK